MADPPIHNLPVEVLTQIFQLTAHCSGKNCSNLVTLVVDTLCDGVWHEVTVHTTPTLDISHTCSHWRAIAISTPSLWSRLDIELYLRVENEVTLDLVNLYLSRSTPALLTLRLGGYDLGDGVDRKIFEAIAKEKFRWQVADFTELMCSDWVDWDFPENGDCENLKVLGLPRISTRDDVNLFFQRIGKTPELHRLSINGSWYSKSILGSLPELLPFQQVTSFDIVDENSRPRVKWCHYHKILSHLPNLQKLSIKSHFRVFTRISDRDVRLECLALPHLQKLVFYVHDRPDLPVSAACFFQSFKAPPLSVLQLDTMKNTMPITTSVQSNFLDSLHTFLGVSECQLRELKLTGDVLDTHMILSLLKATPAVEQLSIHGGHKRLELFEALTIHGQPGSEVDSGASQSQEWGQSIPLPRLTKLDMTVILDFEELEKRDSVEDEADVEDTVDVVLDRISAMVSSRRHTIPSSHSLQSVAALQRFRFCVQRAVPCTESMTKWLSHFYSFTVPRLRALAGGGFELELLTETKYINIDEM
ncbi:hypothetical protein D9758_011624 [Tetrapyrgos nigripes]|uniref:F-box domain-containing protein n=1 Tax=Tetrapyrgos nigripes TaxID=182062 RepID=A0A8H5CS79_9AGAR|nr:hypothetical protein D9758_011624 [Tetrapyrgos nigripes]